MHLLSLGFYSQNICIKGCGMPSKKNPGFLMPGSWRGGELAEWLVFKQVIKHCQIPGLAESGGGFTAPAGDSAAHRSLSIQKQDHGRQCQGKGPLSQAGRSEQAGFCPAHIHPRSFHNFPLNSYLHDAMRQSLAEHLRDMSLEPLAPSTSETPSPALMRCWLQQSEVNVLGSQAQ